jgi:hypothetical protein
MTTEAEERIEELELEVAELKAELRKYEPSDGVMIQLLGLNECIREAAELLDDVLFEKGCSADPKLTAWMSLPAVAAARKFVRGR